MPNHCDLHSVFPFLSLFLSFLLFSHAIWCGLVFLVLWGWVVLFLLGFLPHSPSVLYTFYPLSQTPLFSSTSALFSTSSLMWFCLFSCVVVLMVGFLVLWLSCHSTSLFLLFLYPIHPVYLQLSFTPHLNFLIHPNLSVLVLVKVMRNSTYKVGWKEW